MKSIRAVYWLVLIVVVQVVANFLWLTIDQTPPAWDQSAHLRSAIMFSQKLSGESEYSWLQIVRSGYGYPPLIHFIGGIWGLLFGLGNITSLMTLFWIGLIVGVFFLLKEVLKDEDWAVVGAGIFSLIPVVYDISRSFLLDLPLLMMVTWGLWFWIRSDELKKNSYSWGLLLMLILASLTKLNGFLYFVPIGLMVLFGLIKQPKILGKIIIGVVVYGLLVGWWWGVNWQNIVMYLTGLAGTGEKLTDPMDLTSGVTWIHYFRLFFWNQLSPLAAVIIVGLMVKGRKLGNFWWLYLVINYGIFTIIKNKDYRFIMPLLPVVILMATAGLREWWRKSDEVAIWIGVILISYLLWFFVNNSFSWPIQKEWRWNVKTYLMGDGDLINVTDYPVRSPKSLVWPNREIMKSMVADAKAVGKQKVLVLIDIEQINDNNLKLYRELVTKGGDGIVEMHSIYAPEFNDWNGFDLVLLGEEKMEPAPFYATNLEYLKQARDYVWQNSGRFSDIKEYLLPTGGKVYLKKVLK